MSREAVVIPEKKEKLERLKARYNNLEMSDKTAQNIRKLEVVRGTLKLATVAVGCAAAIDLIVPDPIFGFDEAVLTAATGLLGFGVSMVSSKIDDLAATEKTGVSMDEVENLTNKISTMASAVSAAKNKGPRV